VFLHGSPLWSFTYRYLIKALRGQFRCIAIDSMGFGLSEKPASFVYRPERQAEYISELIGHLGLKEISFVLHGTGGPAGLAYAVDHPQNVAHLALINTFMWPLDDNEGAKRIDHMANGPLGRFLFLNANWPVRMLKHAVIDKKTFSREIAAHYATPLDCPEHRQGPFGCAQALLSSSRFYRTLWERRSAIADVPALLLWGMKDHLFGPDCLSKFEYLFKDPQIHRFSTSGHYVTEEKGPGLVPVVEMFMTDSAYLPTATLM
jgi:haloalkane dehalogenase